MRRSRSIGAMIIVAFLVTGCGTKPGAPMPGGAPPAAASSGPPAAAPSSPAGRKRKPKADGRDIAADVIRIVTEQLDLNGKPVTPASAFVKDLGADSLDCVELIMDFEETFDISIPDADAEKLVTVGQAIEYIRSRTGRK